MVLRSTKSRKPRVPAPFTQRRPLTRSSERLAPRLRRFSELEPWLVPPEPVELKLEPTDGSSCNSAPIEITPVASRSEEHTSELQSLMRISYAVFCLKKKTNILIPQYQPIEITHSRHTRRRQFATDHTQKTNITIIKLTQ